MKRSKIRFSIILTLIAAVAFTTSPLWLNYVSAMPMNQSFSGAIYTSNVNGTVVNQNQYDAKSDVYLNGGPQNANGGGGLPNEIYYFEVTNPSTADLLSEDDAVCRQLFVVGGKVGGVLPRVSDAVPANLPMSVTARRPDGCPAHVNGTLNSSNGSTPVQLIPFLDTTNNGGVYKVSLIRQIADTSIDTNDAKVIHYSNSDSKSDNFKVEIDNGCQFDCQGPPAFISGLKFYDANQDGIFQSANEPIIPGWHIELYNSSNQKIQETDTDADGKYEFVVEFVNGAQYTVKEVLPTVPANQNWANVTPISLTVTLITQGMSPVLNYPDNNFGNIRNAKLSGLKFRDLNMDGDQDMGEGVISGIEISISTVEPTGDPMNPVVVSTYTDMNGMWMSGLHPIGTTYTVCEVVNSSQYLQTAPSSNNGCYSGMLMFSMNDNGTPGDTSDDSNNFFDPVDVGNLNFGNIALYNISGTKYYDSNLNGSFDSGEIGVAGVTINVNFTRPNLTTGIATTMTVSGGGWSVNGLPEGTTYTVCEVVPTGWINTAPTCLPQGTLTGNTTGLNFFNVKLVTPNGGKTLGFWSNKNGSGILSMDDNLMSGWRPYLNSLNLAKGASNSDIYVLNATTTFSNVYNGKTGFQTPGFNPWLLSANATNMAYMLSVQLAANTLDVKEGGLLQSKGYITTPLTGDTAVSLGSLAPCINVIRSGTSGFITLSNLHTMAVQQLALGRYTVAAGTLRTNQECVKNVLDRINNNQLQVVAPSMAMAP